MCKVGKSGVKMIKLDKNTHMTKQKTRLCGQEKRVYWVCG